MFVRDIRGLWSRPSLTAVGGATHSGAPVSPCSLAELPIGVDARIVDVRGADSLRLRLLEMGFVPGTAVRVIKRAPFGDPLELRLRGGHISLRAAEAARVAVEPARREPA